VLLDPAFPPTLYNIIYHIQFSTHYDSTVFIDYVLMNANFPSVTNITLSQERHDLQFHNNCGVSSSSHFNRTKYIFFYKDGRTITQHNATAFSECKHFLTDRRKTDLILYEFFFCII